MRLKPPETKGATLYIRPVFLWLTSAMAHARLICHALEVSISILCPVPPRGSRQAVPRPLRVGSRVSSFIPEPGVPRVVGNGLNSCRGAIRLSFVPLWVRTPLDRDLYFVRNRSAATINFRACSICGPTLGIALYRHFSATANAIRSQRCVRHRFEADY